MKSEFLKQFTGVISVLAASVTFLIFAFEFKGSSIDPRVLALVAIAGSAYAAVFSVVISRRLERKRLKQRIFIIYSHKDKDKAEKISEELTNLGFNPWFDQKEILPGQKWREAIKRAIEESAVALYLASKNTEASKGFINEEMKAAMQVLRSRSDAYSPVIPVLLEESSLPDELRDIHAVKYYEESGKESLNRGLRSVFEAST